MVDGHLYAIWKEIYGWKFLGKECGVVVNGKYGIQGWEMSVQRRGKVQGERLWGEYVHTRWAKEGERGHRGII